jgi:hypothetical protein
MFRISDEDLATSGSLHESLVDDIHREIVKLHEMYPYGWDRPRHAWFFPKWRKVVRGVYQRSDWRSDMAMDYIVSGTLSTQSLTHCATREVRLIHASPLLIGENQRPYRLMYPVTKIVRTYTDDDFSCRTVHELKRGLKNLRKLTTRTLTPT